MSSTPKLKHRVGRVEALAERRPGAAPRQAVFAYPGAPEPPPGFEGIVVRLTFDPTPRTEPAQRALAQGGRLALPPPGTRRRPRRERAPESGSPESNRSPRRAVPPEPPPAARTQAGAEQPATERGPAALAPAPAAEPAPPTPRRAPLPAGREPRWYDRESGIFGSDF